MRAFIAIELPQEVRAVLARLQERLATAKADVKWTQGNDLHVTMRFLGDIDEAQRQGVEALLERVAQEQEPFTLSVGGAGAFPSIEAPRVIWAGLAEGGDCVRRLAEAIEREGVAIPLRREERSLSAHITLGRARSSKGLKALAQQMRGVAWQAPAPWRVTTLTLYQSVLTPTGPRYTVLAEAPLGARRSR